MQKATIQRQRLIADFIDEGNVSSQNQLKGMLKKNGIIITQATLSRDLSEIGAVKKRFKNGRLIYILPTQEENSAQFKIATKALKDFVLDVDFVLNQVIVKTLTAAATVVADSIDNLNISGMAASIAGDNVVLIITKGEIEAKNVANQLNDYIK
ncbi:MAG: hypothetical protein O3A48_02730 [Actinomycetota bacterium]|nr:hypothetical protein [Actinomycetota bacterium]MDA3013434.1 hypothetical protein [Actinomycetota bacterium]